MIYPPEAVTISEVPPPGAYTMRPYTPHPEIAPVGADFISARQLGIDPYMSGIS